MVTNLNNPYAISIEALKRFEHGMRGDLEPGAHPVAEVNRFPLTTNEVRALLLQIGIKISLRTLDTLYAGMDDALPMRGRTRMWEALNVECLARVVMNPENDKGDGGVPYWAESGMIYRMTNGVTGDDWVDGLLAYYTRYPSEYHPNPVNRAPDGTVAVFLPKEGGYKRVVFLPVGVAENLLARHEEERIAAGDIRVNPHDQVPVDPPVELKGDE